MIFQYVAVQWTSHLARSFSASPPIGMSSTHTYIVPLAMLAIALMLIAAALWL
jgi:hypothetical protein